MPPATQAHIGFPRYGVTAIRLALVIGAVLLVGAIFPGGTDLTQINGYWAIGSIIVGIVLLDSRNHVFSVTIHDTGAVEIRTLFGDHDVSPRTRVEHDLKIIKSDEGGITEQSYDYIELSYEDRAFLISKTEDNMEPFLSALRARNKKA